MCCSAAGIPRATRSTRRPTLSARSSRPSRRACPMRSVSGAEPGALTQPRRAVRHDAGAGCGGCSRRSRQRSSRKALKKNPAERYASVDAFADDLRRHLRHEPIAARAQTRCATARRSSCGGIAARRVATARRWSLLIAGLTGVYTARLAARARSRAARSGKGRQGQRAADGPADQRRSLRRSAARRASRRCARCSTPAPRKCRRSSPASPSCRPRC